MKRVTFFLSLFITCQAFAQNSTISGTVANDHGQPVRYAFVQDVQSKTAAYSDSTGTFSLTTGPSAQLTVNCPGYSNTTVDAAGHNNLQITLKADPSAPSTAIGGDAARLAQSFKTSTGYDIMAAMAASGATISNTRDVVGSRFLYNQWVPGYVIKLNGLLSQSPLVLFNYDKMKGDLYMDQLNKVSVADKDAIKGFVLMSPQDQPVAFERMTGISNTLYSQVLSTGPKYKIYKLITTKYNPADYKTDGVYATGNKYDEFADNNTYYVVNVGTTAFQPLALKKKAIKEAFAAEGDKINAFMTAHSSDKIDDDYLKALGDAMNK